MLVVCMYSCQFPAWAWGGQFETTELLYSSCQPSTNFEKSFEKVAPDLWIIPKVPIICVSVQFSIACVDKKIMICMIMVNPRNNYIFGFRVRFLSEQKQNRNCSVWQLIFEIWQVCKSINNSFILRSFNLKNLNKYSEV